ncbi:ATP-binding protein [Sorangium sp. So ce145]|uniref:ATP-binding protein n=1 Tax=Sorangium sp. So ce145 TaxID=3133285 RepID=UPI003F61243A
MDIRNTGHLIGKVASVDGSAIVVEAERLSLELSDDVEVHVTIGSFINCGGTHGDVLCAVIRVYEEQVERPNREIQGQRQIITVRKIDLIVVGTVSDSRGFERGVDQLPPVGTSAFFVTGSAFEEILERSLDHTARLRLFPVGERVGTGSGSARFDLDRFFGRHAAILGTTGSGKSYTVAALGQAVLRSYSRPRLILFDIHNEYPPAFQGEFSARSQCIPWSSFKLPFWMLTFDEFVDIFGGGNLGSTQKAVLTDALQAARRQSPHNVLGKDDSRISADSPIPFSWDDLHSNLKSTINSKKPSEQGSLPAMLEKMDVRRQDPRFEFFFRSAENTDAAGAFFAKLFGLVDGDTHITVLDLSGLPAEVRSTAIGVLGRLIFDYRYWDPDPNNLPIALVLEEAHTYIPAESDSRYRVSLESIERIAKEGRKYGLSLVVVSQRPSSVSPSILSQCGTFVALRLTSDTDQDKVLRLLPDTLGSQKGVLASLRDGEAIVSGDGVTLPGRIRFKFADPKPGSADIRFHQAWAAGPPNDYSPVEIARRWLRQERH